MRSPSTHGVGREVHIRTIDRVIGADADRGLFTVLVLHDDRIHRTALRVGHIQSLNLLVGDVGITVCIEIYLNRILSKNSQQGRDDILNRNGLRACLRCGIAAGIRSRGRPRAHNLVAAHADTVHDHITVAEAA